MRNTHLDSKLEDLIPRLIGTIWSLIRILSMRGIRVGHYDIQTLTWPYLPFPLLFLSSGRRDRGCRANRRSPVWPRRRRRGAQPASFSLSLSFILSPSLCVLRRSDQRLSHRCAVIDLGLSLPSGGLPLSRSSSLSPGVKIGAGVQTPPSPLACVLIE